jgi:hypothetical protein
MGTLKTQSAFDSAIEIRFDIRNQVPPQMAAAIRRAFVLEYQARVSDSHDFGFEFPVRFAAHDDAFRIAEKGVPTHVIVCTERGGECILALYPRTDSGEPGDSGENNETKMSHFECFVLGAERFAELIAAHVGPRYVEYASREKRVNDDSNDAPATEWLHSFGVPGLYALYCDDDGEFAGALVDFCTMTIDGTVPDTTARNRTGYEVGEHVPDTSNSHHMQVPHWLEMAPEFEAYEKNFESIFFGRSARN